MPKFVNREQELRALTRACSPGMAVVSGRRRVGKTALLDHFSTERASVFLPGTRAPIGEALRRLEERVRAVVPPLAGDLLDLGHFETWDTALGYLIARSSDDPLLLVLDEFPYLCEADPSLPSTLQARWDHRGESQLSIILAGSHVGLMEELVSTDAPLFGRPDMHLRLGPFSWQHAPLLVGGDDPDVWMEAYVTLGGMPRYLALWDPRHDAATNLAELLDGPGAPLGDEGTVVLQELTPGSAAARVLELVALDASTFTTIRDRAGLAPATTSEALTSLERLGLLDRITPAGEDPRRTRKVRYRVRDPFLRLWLGVVLPTATPSSSARVLPSCDARPTGSPHPRRPHGAASRRTGWPSRPACRAASGGAVPARTSSTSSGWTAPIPWSRRRATGRRVSTVACGGTGWCRRCRRPPTRSMSWPARAPGS